MNGSPLAYLDSAATTQKPARVIDAVDDFYRTTNANVHRGAYALSAEATAAYEGARGKVASFLNAGSPAEIVFSRGATASLNHIAYGWGLNHLSKGDRVLLTMMEHHANVVPWQLIARHTGIELVYLPLDDRYEVDLSALDDVIDDRVKVVSFSGMSNVTGTLGPVEPLVAAARSVGALVIVDGAQLVPHAPVDVQSMGADFLVFSGHKMLGPTGIGVMWGTPELLEEMEPTEGGGEMIADVDLYESRWAPAPHKFEAGTPPIAQAVGLGAAIDYLRDVGMDAVAEHDVRPLLVVFRQHEDRGVRRLIEEAGRFLPELPIDANLHGADVAGALREIGHRRLLQHERLRGNRGIAAAQHFRRNRLPTRHRQQVEQHRQRRRQRRRRRARPL